MNDLYGFTPEVHAVYSALVNFLTAKYHQQHINDVTLYNIDQDVAAFFRYRTDLTPAQVTRDANGQLVLTLYRPAEPNETGEQNDEENV